MKVKTTIALIIDNQRIEAGSTIDIDDATYPSIAAYVTVLESDAPVAEVRAIEAEPVEAEAEPVEVETEPVAEVTEDKPKRKRA
ncbi:hypothetical protein LU290_05045 [Moraxella nasibovis]|uniref:hypothetical protein n=1 Tax=Moraxella nasibovis TaxID=2904120 RepID=UPI00241036AC|nr:hypothetical protein [Moraxella nasibovis]WFF39587.1 hypothetical protein LU290_05045 [Moraxella nasibovis]